MARKRMIDPNIWQSEDFSNLSVFERVLFIGMFSNADDYGYGRAKPEYLKSIIFPYDEKIKASDISKALDNIANHMSIVFYQVGNSEYYYLTNWSKWQKVEKPSDSLIPPFSDNAVIAFRSLVDQSSNVRQSIPPNRREEKRIEEKENEKLQLFGEFNHVRMEQTKYDKLVSLYGKTTVESKISYLDAQIENGIRKYMAFKNHYATVGNWCRSDAEKSGDQKKPEQNLREIKKAEGTL